MARSIAQHRRLIDAAAEPITVADAKAWLRVDSSAEDALVADLITAARQVCEGLNNRSFVATTWEYTLQRCAWDGWHPGWYGADPGWSAPYVFPGYAYGWQTPAIRLPMPPLIDVQSIEHLATDGTATVIDPGQYRVLPGTPGYVSTPSGMFWDGTFAPESLRITYTAGYGPSAADVPRPVVQAIRLLVAHYYEHRTINAQVPEAVAGLLDATSWGGYG